MAEPCRPSLALVALLLAGGLQAADFFDYADVTAVEPLVEREWRTAPIADCPGGPTDPGGPAPRAAGVGVSSFVDALRGDLDLAACDGRRSQAERIVGYRVTYRYADTEYVHVLDSDPGPKLRIQVRVEADR